MFWAFICCSITASAFLGPIFSMVYSIWIVDSANAHCKFCTRIMFPFFPINAVCKAKLSILRLLGQVSTIDHSKLSHSGFQASFSSHGSYINEPEIAFTWHCVSDLTNVAKMEQDNATNDKVFLCSGWGCGLCRLCMHWYHLIIFIQHIPYWIHGFHHTHGSTVYSLAVALGYNTEHCCLETFQP